MLKLNQFIEPQKTVDFPKTMEKYHEAKNNYSGALPLFKVGDFYETYSDDAYTLSYICGLSLRTQYFNDFKHQLRMCGFPQHKLDEYLPKLIGANIKVAIFN